jgi:hypothetical protein
LHNRTNGFTTTIASDLWGDGDPFFIPLTLGQMLIVDGANKPRLINNGVASTVTWPPVYSVQNNTLLNESNNATASNPTTFGTDIGYPSFGALYENRAWLAGDQHAPYRIYVSKILDFDEFGDNSGATFDVAFFVDVQTESPITALKVVNNQYMVIYCEREILVLTGKFPPGTAFPAPYFQISSLNSSIGCLGPRLVTDKGDNDHYFVANNGVIYTLNNTDNFQDVRPKGLSSKIFPELQGIDNETFKRGLLINHQIKGELHFWFPSENYLRYPDQRYILAYANSQEEEEWSRDTGFGDFYLRDALMDDETNDLVLVTPTKFLIDGEGTTFDGTDIDMVYQLSTLDFGDPDKRKEVVNVTIEASNESNEAVDCYFYNLWENGQSGFYKFTIEPTLAASYGSAVYNTSKYGSFAGKLFNEIPIQISNKIGKKLKCRIRQTQAGKVFIHSILFRYKFLGT